MINRVKIKCGGCGSQYRPGEIHVEPRTMLVCPICCAEIKYKAIDFKAEAAESKHETAVTGAVRSKVYPQGTQFPARYDLMMRNAAGMRRLAETWGEGFEKYGADNWMKGFPISVFMSHTLEHIRLYLAGDRSEDHLGHGAWNLLAACWVEENKPELCDLTMPTQVCFQACQAPEPKP